MKNTGLLWVVLVWVLLLTGMFVMGYATGQEHARLDWQPMVETCRAQVKQDNAQLEKSTDALRTASRMLGQQQRDFDAFKVAFAKWCRR